MKALAEYVAAKGVSTSNIDLLARGYSDFIAKTAARAEAKSQVDQRQQAFLGQLFNQQMPAARDAATWDARHGFIGNFSDDKTSKVSEQLSRARQQADSYLRAQPPGPGDRFISEKAHRAEANMNDAARQFDTDIAFTNNAGEPKLSSAERGAANPQNPEAGVADEGEGAPEPWSQTRDAASSLCGVGLKLRVTDSEVLITEIVHDSPAWRSALAVGDSIIAVDGQNVRGCSLAQVVQQPSPKPELEPKP